MGRRNSGTYWRKEKSEARFHNMLRYGVPEGSTLPVVSLKSLPKHVQEQIRQQKECPRSMINVEYDYPDFVAKVHGPSKHMTCKYFDHATLNPYDQEEK